jgi:iron complex outermembrane receptor protein
MMKQILTVALLLTGAAYAQETATKLDSNLKEFQVTATRGSVEFEEAARKVTLITKQEIEQSAVQSIPELLEYVSNIDVRQRGPLGVQADLSIRGSSFEQVLVLLNGIKMNDPQTGHLSMNLPISLVDIERIEVLHGGSARIYGPNAFAGAINIITKNPTENEVQANVSVGDFGYTQLGASATLVHKNTSHRFSVERTASDGYERNTDFEQLNAFWESEARLGKHEIRFNLGQNEKLFGAQNFYSARFPYQQEKNKAQFTSLVGKLRLGKENQLVITPRAYYRRHFDRFELFREGEGYYHRIPGGGFASNEGDTVTWYTSHNYHRTDVYGAEVNATYESFLGKTSIGYDYRYEGVNSNNLGKPKDGVEQVVNEHPSAVYDLSDWRENHSIYFEQSYNHEWFHISAGALYNTNNRFGEDFLPGIDASVRILENLRAYGSVNKSFRFPSFTDLYYSLGGAEGSEDLDPEESLNYEGGFKYNSSTVRGHLAYFRREGSNMIDWITYDGEEGTQAANITEITMNGVEVDFVYNLSSTFEKLPLTRVSGSYTHLWADANTDGFSSIYALDYLAHKVDVGLHFRFSKILFADWMVSFQEREGDYTDAQGIENAYDPVLLSDLQLRAQLNKKISMYVQANNLFDIDYVDIGNVQQPGRWVKAGANIRFGY